MLGYLFYMFSAAFGITALVLQVPAANAVLGAVSSMYLVYLAWQAAMLFISLLPQFIDHTRNDVMGPSLMLGLLLIAAFALANGLVAVGSSGMAKFLNGRPTLLLAQRWVTAAMLAGLGVSLGVDSFRLFLMA